MISKMKIIARFLFFDTVFGLAKKRENRYTFTVSPSSIMHISWLGNTAVRIQAKPNTEDIVVVFDPYRPAAGSFPRSLAPHIALFTRGEEGGITLSGTPFILATSGECETKGVLITAAPSNREGELIFRIDAEGLSVAHLGLTNKELTDAQLEVVGDADILLLSVGAVNAYDAEQAVKAVNAIEPRIVIPIAFRSENDPKAATADAFLKEMGAKTDKPEPKAIVKKKDLPQDEMRVILLSKE